MKNIDLLKFQKPGRYTGGEWNLNFNPPKSTDLRICLCFPEIYEIGMSNLGFRIIHEIFNSQENLSCERCFMPASDLEKHIFTEKIPLFSLETKTPLKDFDLVAFSINYELNFINFLKMLEMGGIPIQRNKRHKPLVMVGGLNNPEPLEKFVDVFFLGEFEDRAFSFIEKIKEARNLSKEEKTLSLAEIEGIYVPEFYYQENSHILPKDKNVPFPLRRAYLKDLNRYFYPQSWIMPFTSIIFDRLQVELQRGCPNQCKFCQARCTYWPYRQRESKVVSERIRALYKTTGYEAISLLGLSVIDYQGLSGLLDEIIPYFKKKRVAISIPSLRPVKGTTEIIKKLAYAKKPGLTLALEAGNEKLRNFIGKNIDIDECIEVARIAAHLGYRHLKLYFMLGLPGETTEDVVSIGDTLELLALAYRKEKGFFPQVNATISYFNPKPFSPFQNYGLEDKPSFDNKKNTLRKRISKNKFMKLNFSDFDKTYLEHLLSKADRRISGLIEDIFYQELKLKDSFLNIGSWRRSGQKYGLNLDLFLNSTDSLEHVRTNQKIIQA
ncbi:MAG: TIGR03960 family B12-binding radical SAM protein [Candidatus Omnitrophica bacterium]|nr:TIGR03960 family B12-binding radical SAM protein [Candidatus Omnitrophota bacterium]